MFYSFIVRVMSVVFFLINGKFRVQNKEKLPKDGNYILAGPHRSLLDPVYFGLAAYPKQFTYMAKEELFKNKLLGWFLRKLHAFPVNREKPGPSALKIPIKALKDTSLGFVIFPSGSRHSEEAKGGAATIAKLAGVPIVPVVYQGPLTFWGLFSRKNTYVRFGDPIYIDRKTKLDQETLERIDQELQDAYKQLDFELNPDFKYEAK